jgi:hypothetical protein
MRVARLKFEIGHQNMHNNMLSNALFAKHEKPCNTIECKTTKAAKRQAQKCVGQNLLDAIQHLASLRVRTKIVPTYTCKIPLTLE